jgi:hypothetical protein
MIPTGHAYGLPFPPARKRRDTGCCPECGFSGARAYADGQLEAHWCDNHGCRFYGETLPLLEEGDGSFTRRLYGINYPVPEIRFIELQPGGLLCPICAHRRLPNLDDDQQVTVHTFPIDRIPECGECGWKYLLDTILKDSL